jgi:drug/metabolite transporter (DMT)-like permease
MADQPEPPPRGVVSTGPFLGVATITLTLAGWTTIPLFLRFFKDDIDGWTANGWRYAFSALIWLPVWFVSFRRGTWPKGLWRAAFWPSMFNAAGQVCFGLAPYYIEPGLMTFSLRLQIVFVTIAAAIMFAAERAVIRSPLFIVGLGMVIAGTAATLLLKEGGLGEGEPLGVGLAILSGLLYASYSLGVRRAMVGVNPLKAFAAVSQYTAAILVSLMLLFGEDAGATVVGLSNFKLWMLALSAIVGIGLGHTFYYLSITRLGLAASAGVVQLQPITVSIASFYLFGEKLSTAQWATGIAAIIGAGLILFAQHASNRKKLALQA